MSEDSGRVGCAETGSREPDPQAVPAASGFDPARGEPVALPCEIAEMKRNIAIRAARLEYTTKRDRAMHAMNCKIEDAWTEYRHEMDRNLRKACAA